MEKKEVLKAAQDAMDKKAGFARIISLFDRYSSERAVVVPSIIHAR
ncbi:MAG: hypothetical protein ACI92G_004625 [Candidatus Pelagisphaera sp.]